MPSSGGAITPPSGQCRDTFSQRPSHTFPKLYVQSSPCHTTSRETSHDQRNGYGRIRRTTPPPVRPRARQVHEGHPAAGAGRLQREPAGLVAPNDVREQRRDPHRRRLRRGNGTPRTACTPGPTRATTPAGCLRPPLPQTSSRAQIEALARALDVVHAVTVNGFKLC